MRARAHWRHCRNAPKSCAKAKAQGVRLVRVSQMDTDLMARRRLTSVADYRL